MQNETLEQQIWDKLHDNSSKQDVSVRKVNLPSGLLLSVKSDSLRKKQKSFENMNIKE